MPPHTTHKPLSGDELTLVCSLNPFWQDQRAASVFPFIKTLVRVRRWKSKGGTENNQTAVYQNSQTTGSSPLVKKTNWRLSPASSNQSLMPQLEPGNLTLSRKKKRTGYKHKKSQHSRPLTKLLKWGDGQFESLRFLEVLSGFFRFLSQSKDTHLGDRFVTIWGVHDPITTQHAGEKQFECPKGGQRHRPRAQIQ